MMNSLLRTVNCDNLWRPWYVILVTCMQAVLLYSGVMRYLAFKGRLFDPKYGGNWNPAAMNFSLAMLITASFFVCLFLYASLNRGSNLAEEGVPVGQGLVVYTPGQYAWQHQQPQSQQEGSNAGLYATANGVLGRGNLSAGLGVGGDQEEEEESVPPFDSWSARSAAQVPLSDFPAYHGGPVMLQSMVFTPTSAAQKDCWMPLSVVWRWLQLRFIPTTGLMHLLSAYAFFLHLPVLEAQLISHYALPIENIWKSNLNPLLLLMSTNAMSAEFFNLLFAFAVLALRYPSVFWRANHSFAFTFSLVLVLLGLHGLLELNSAEILVKLCWNKKEIVSSFSGLCKMAVTETPKLDAKLDPSLTAFEKPTEDGEDLRNATPLFISVCGTLVMLFLSSAVFDYGVEQFIRRISALRRNAAFCPRSLDGALSDATSIHGAEGNGVCGSRRKEPLIGRRATICRRLAAVVGALWVLAIKMPILLACGRAFEISRCPLLLANIVATVIFFCVWFIVWFAFCLKTEWKFKVTFSPAYHPSAFHPTNPTTQHLSTSGTMACLQEGSAVNGTLMATIPGASGTQRGQQDCVGAVTGVRLTPNSPLFHAFFHDSTMNRGLGRLLTVTTPPPPPPPTGQSTRAAITSQQTADCCSVDTEGSSRLSGANNYVCLQSSLNATNSLRANALHNESVHQSFRRGEQVDSSSSSFAPPSQDNDGLQYSRHPREALAPRGLGFLHSDSDFVPGGSGAAGANPILAGCLQESLNFLPQSSSTASTTTVIPVKPDGVTPKQLQTHVTFKALAETLKAYPNAGEPSSSSNPNSSSDSGIDNQVPPTTVAPVVSPGGPRFSTLPGISRKSLSSTFTETNRMRTTEPTYTNQEGISHSPSSSSASSTSTPQLFECPSMPPLNLLQNKTGEVSFASLSRQFNLRKTSFDPPPSIGSEQLMSRSAVIRRDNNNNNNNNATTTTITTTTTFNNNKANTGPLCSQV